MRGLAASMAVMVLSVAFYGSLALYSDSHGQFGKVGRRQTGPNEAGFGFHGLEVCCKQSREEPASTLLCWHFCESGIKHWKLISRSCLVKMFSFPKVLTMWC